MRYAPVLIGKEGTKGQCHLGRVSLGAQERAYKTLEET